MTKEFAALIFIGLLVLVVLVYAVFSTRERSGAVEARLAAMSGLGGANNRLAKNAQLAAFLRQPECQATILVMMGALLLGWFLKLSIAAEVLLLVIKQAFQLTVRSKSWGRPMTMNLAGASSNSAER